MRRIYNLLQKSLISSFLILASTPAKAQIIPDNTLGKESSQLNQNVLINGLNADKIDGGATRGVIFFIASVNLISTMGSALMKAIARSYDLGYQGRIGLHTRTGAFGFYPKLRFGFIDCGSNPDEPDNLVYFEILRRS